MPAHLQDLKEGDLPEGQRVAVLDQIAVFREASARKERQKKLFEQGEELVKAQQAQSSNYKKPPNVQDYGYGNRAFVPPSQSSNSRQPPQINGNASGRGARDPQGYSKPVNFQPAQSAEAKVDSGRTDEEEEEIRLMKKAREKEAALRDVSTFLISRFPR